jgi:hypothetical protein
MLLGSPPEVLAELGEAYPGYGGDVGGEGPLPAGVAAEPLGAAGGGGGMPFLPLKPQFEAYVLAGATQPLAAAGQPAVPEPPPWWNATMLPLASPRSLPTPGDDIELRNLSRADVEYVMLQEAQIAGM